ncbi:MAG: DNA cytosine methyltransferase [Bryobacteraceae bacterium]
MRHPWYEFFAGGGMARLGLGERNWKCVFANDNSSKKAAAYRTAFGGGDELKRCDIAHLTSGDLPGQAVLAWASFPCQDLSLAGNGAGLNGKRSGTFHAFWNLIERLKGEERMPRIVVLENVTGALSSHLGIDFRAILERMTASGYRTGALVIDAVLFLPQSRPRLFIIGVRRSCVIPPEIESQIPLRPWHTTRMQKSLESMPAEFRKQWIWWNLPQPNTRVEGLCNLLLDRDNVIWHSPKETERLLSLMSQLHRKKVEDAMVFGTTRVGTVYKRTRPLDTGGKEQRAEVRFDNISGCLRTPAGGSSRQIVLAIEGNKIQSRLLAPREAARLMGVPDTYVLPASYNDAYHLFGDGLAVPVVQWLNRHLLLPLADAPNRNEIAA